MKNGTSHFALAVITALLLSACSDGGYYLQAASGQLEILKKRQPIVEIIKADQTSPTDKEQLTRILQIRDFASAELLLPENNSYRSYVELDRPYPVWNVVAAPEFSLDAKTWCFPIAGCVSYRGYFSDEAARQKATELEAQGFDTLVAGVPAYSTLSWFDDPVLSSFSHWPTASVARLIFHELAHQKLYLPGDSDFNEAFATSVEIEGTKRWLDRSGGDMDRARFTQQLAREKQFSDWSTKLYHRLNQLYHSKTGTQEMRQRKAELLQNARADYESLKSSWDGYSGYDRWVADLNNAHLVSLKTYRRLLPAFSNLLVTQHGDLSTFYARCKKLSEQPAERRNNALEVLITNPNILKE